MLGRQDRRDVSDPDPQPAAPSEPLPQTPPDPDDELALLRREVAELREAVRARTDLIALAGHELRNPLTAVAMLVQALLAAAQADPAVPARLAAGLARLDHSVARCVERVTLLLDISRLAAGSSNPEPGRVDLSAVVRETAEALEPVAARRGVSLELDVQDGIVGHWDELGLQHIAENLLGNAVKYGEGKPVDVVLRRDGERAVLRVRDRGMGVAEADQARIFEPFERAVRRGQAGGFGLGLWVVGRAVEAMAGSVSVESRPGEGAAFTVSLPFVPPGAA